MKRDSGARRQITLDWGNSGPTNTLRDTGIDLVGRIPWGSHLCIFCETKQDLLDTVLAYFEPALRANESCVWVVSDPLTLEEALGALAQFSPALFDWHKTGRFEIIAAQEWYCATGRFEWKKVLDGWHHRISDATQKGFDGIRACGKPLWREVEAWRDVAEYEHAVQTTFQNQRIIMLCTYMTQDSTTDEVLDVANAHQCVIARRRGKWQFLAVPGENEAKRELDILNRDLDVVPKHLVRDGILTEREAVILGQLFRGRSSKQIARDLGISPRTVEFHRAKMMEKVGAKNTADLVRKTLLKS